MATHGLTDDQLALLARYDTPTICNALEMVMPERQAIGFTTEALVAANPSLPPIVGYARTATIRAVEPSGLSPAEQREKRLAYYEYVAAGPRPSIVVIQDLDPRPGFGAFWGEVQTAVHKGLGCLGGITNGSIRDLDQIAPGFQLLAGQVGPSHAHVHVVDFGTPVNVHGMTVRHGDLVHADRHGAVVVPLAAVAGIPKAIEIIGRREKLILDAARSNGFTVAKLKAAMKGAADIH
ncbi:MAG TPA: RraA family protein [Alphaproteobacteria bacterium]|nr:RraA family protein [Alphaproteobacteria bacterium]